jgi:hypothetical protein
MISVGLDSLNTAVTHGVKRIKTRETSGTVL